MNLTFILCALTSLACAAETASPTVPAVDTPWTHPLTHKRKLNSPLVEVTPFVFKERLYRLENWQKQWEFPGSPVNTRFQEDEVRIRDVEQDRIVATPLRGHGLGMAFVWQGRVYIFAGNWGQEKKWQITEIEMTSSDDLVNWTKPVVVLRAEPQEKFFNVAICRGRDAFVLLVESNDPKWPPFTFKYFKSDDLVHWTSVPDAIYGRDKYVGGPALYFEGDWFYTLYLESLGRGQYETRITRSRDLLRWQDAPAGRPFVTFNTNNMALPLRPPNLCEQNASDAELVYWKDKTLVYFTGSDQQLAGDLQSAEFNGTPRELFEYFFKDDGGSDTVVPEHAGDWYPVLVKGRDSTNAATATTTNSADFHTYLQQVKELLTQYGDLCALWIDGAYDPFGWDVMDSATGRVIGTEHARAIYAYAHALQSDTVIFGGFLPDVRWSGSEEGWAAYPLFNAVAKGTGQANWISPEAEGWFIPEAVLHTRSTWFWSTNSDSTLKSVDGLVQVYYESIGRGANLLMNMTPDPTGRIPEAEVKRLAEFGAEIQRRFSHPIAELVQPDRWTAEHALELDLLGVRAVDHLVIEEDLRYGQRIREYQVEAQTASGWKPVASGSTVGRRRIEKFAPVRTAKLRFRVTQADAIPQVRRLAAYSGVGAPSSSAYGK